MNTAFSVHFEQQYQLHLKHLKLKGLQPKTIDAYARAIRRLGGYFSGQIDALSEAQLTEYFSDLIGTHSWSADTLGSRLQRRWRWLQGPGLSGPLPVSGRPSRRRTSSPAGGAGQVSFRYRDSQTGKSAVRTLSGARFLSLLLQHVLPKGFRRSRNFGFLHPNSKRLIALLQIVPKVAPEPGPTWMKPRPPFLCACCGAPMRIVQRRIPAPERWPGLTPTGSVSV